MSESNVLQGLEKTILQKTIEYIECVLVIIIIIIIQQPSNLVVIKWLKIKTKIKNNISGWVTHVRLTLVNMSSPGHQFVGVATCVAEDYRWLVR